MEEDYYEWSSDDENEACISHFYSSGSDSDNEDNEGFFQKVMERHAAKSNSSKCHFGDLQPDPFEEEMADELNNAMLSLKSFGCASSSGGNPHSPSGPGQKSEKGSQASSSQARPEGQYESIYFDSDEDEDCEDVKQHRKTVSDADLLYDPTLDDQDQLWMDEHRRQYSSMGPEARAGGGGGLSEKKKKKSDDEDLPQSDAVLNCPGCLSMLCTDCQRHVTYGNQYRAMFVFNCRVDRTQLLRCPAKLTKSEIRKNKKKERQLRKMMRKKVSQSKDVLDGIPGSFPLGDPEAEVRNAVSAGAEKGLHQQPEYTATCPRSDALPNVQGCPDLDPQAGVSGETMEVDETLAKKPSSVCAINSTPGLNEIAGDECSANGDVVIHGSASRGVGSSIGSASSSLKSNLSSKRSLSMDEESDSFNRRLTNSSSLPVKENVSILKENSSSTSISIENSSTTSIGDEKISSHAESCSNEAKITSVEQTSPSTGRAVNKHCEANTQTSGGVLKRMSCDDSSSPSKKVRFSGEIRELGPKTASEEPCSAALLQAASEDVFHPVLCRHCNTKVAVFDKDEVYHFFNVITSY